MLASSHNSSLSGSAMSQNSVSPLHSSGPLTPPEAAPGNLPATPQTPASPRRSPRATRKRSRPPLYPQPSSFEALAYPVPHASPHPQTMSPANLMPAPSSTIPMGSLGSSYGSSHSPMMGSPLGHAHPSQFQPYAHGYPTASYFPSQAPPMSQSWSQQSSLSQSSRPMQSDAEGEDDYDLAANMADLDGTPDPNRSPASAAMLNVPGPSASAIAGLDTKPPRPPNAWIIYRSDMLKAISAGRTIPGLDAVMKEAGYGGSSGTGSSGEESGMAATDDDGKSGGKPKKKAKGKKGAKEPTEGLLSLGRGKTGRGLPQAHISKMISTLWKRESQEVRGKYERLSEKKKLEHAEKYPDYKFQPMRRADKIRIKELGARERKAEKEAAKIEKQIQKAATRGTAHRKAPGTRSRPSTSPYSFDPTPSLNRTNDGQGLHKFGQGKPRQGKASDSNITEWHSTYEQAPFPFPIEQPQAGPSHYPPTPYETSSSSDPSRHQTRQSSPSKPIPIMGTPVQYDQTYMMPPPPVPMQSAPMIDPSLYAQTPAPTPAAYEVPPQPYMPAQGFYYDTTGLGAAYAQPVSFEPQSLPESVGLDDLYPDFGTEDPTQLIEQWVDFIPDDDNAVASGSGSGNGLASGEMDASWLQDPNAAAAAWGDLSGEMQEQVFHDLDLSHAMAVQLVPDLDMSLISPYPMDGSYMPDALQPEVDYDTGYLSMPYFTFEEHLPLGHGQQADSGPFLTVQQPMSPDPNGNATTPRQSTFAHNATNTAGQSSTTTNTPSLDPSGVFEQAPAPRFVSASAFPDTPLSVDPSGLGGLDRRISYANAGLDWRDDNDDSHQGSVKAEHQSPTKQDLPPSPRSAHPASTSTSTGSSPTKSPHPPRGGRRARSVAAAF